MTLPEQGDPSSMQAWVLRGYGDPRDVLAREEIDRPSPAPHQLLVKVEATGIAFPDLLRVQGLYQIVQPLGTAPGSEFVGRVVGGGAQTTIEPGTRVMGTSDIGDGTLAEYLVVPQASVSPVSEDMPAKIAATLSNYVTSYHALHTRAKVQPGEVVVVNGGAGGVGCGAIQLAVAEGARVIAVDLGASRVQLCLDFGAHAAVDSSGTDLVAAVKEFSGDHGADVVIDTVGGDVFHACRRAIASEGRIVIVGFTSGHIPELKLNNLILRNFTVMGINAFFYADQFAARLQQIADLWADGKIAPPVEAEYPFDEAPTVFQRLAEKKVKGRAVVRVP
jgi:NADPH:quinone reductase-like Zn-dependent oxidoreductase